MTSVERKEHIATWNGDATLWLDYVKRVRLQYERTEPKKRCLLGAELASRLTGKAWDVASAEIDHSKLQQSNGASYLLSFLEERLCKTPVPDVGQRLEEFFMKLRRQPGTSMTEWATSLRESYKRLQRAMARQRQQSQPTSSLKETAPAGHTTPLTTPSRERRSDRTTPQARHETFATFPDVEVTSNPGRAGDDQQEPFEPDAPRRSDYAEVPQDDDQRWTAAEWRDWQRNRWSWWEDSSSPWPEEEEVKWEQFEFYDVQILPQELLGWLLLRRSGLPAAARLSVLSAINNKLDLETMERAMRDQEEELLMAEHHRAPHLARPRRSFWVEQDSEWGLLNEPDMDEVEEASIYWVGDRLPPEVYPSWEEPATAWTSWSPDGQELTWTWQEDDFYAQDMAGAFWSWTEYKEWLDAEDMALSNPDDSENIFAVYAAFQEKMRSFRDSRKLNYAKQHSRGYYPLSMFKGKSKGKSKKGKPKGSFGSPPSSTSTALASFQKGKGSSGTQRPGNPEYRGCFICGSKEHDFRSCPRRNGDSGTSSSARPNYFQNQVFVILSVDENETTVLTADGEDTASSLAAVAVEYPGHAVIDLGATESLASLDALQEIMNLRLIKFGEEEVIVKEETKKFKFGNGGTQRAASFVELPQVIGGTKVALGVHAIDAPGVPLLLSVRTLRRMGAVIDTERNMMQLRKFSEEWIQLKQSSNEHLLLDMTCSSMPSVAKALTTLAAATRALHPVLHGYGHSGSHPYEGGIGVSSKHWDAGKPLDDFDYKFQASAEVQKRQNPDSREVRHDQNYWSSSRRSKELRISYTPAFGATALHRQAGPLPADVTTTIEQLEPQKIKEDPMYREQLNAKSVGYKGAEDSLHRRLKEIEESKKKNPPRQRPGAAKDTEMPSVHASSAQRGAQVTPEQKKSTKRENDQTPEHEEWSLVKEPDSPEQDDEKYQNGRCGFLTDSQRTQLCLCAEEFLEEAHSAWQDILPPEDGIDLMEICCPPDSRLTQTFLDRGRKAIRVGLPAHNIATSKGVQEIKNMITRWKPKLTWFSLPCGPFSPIQELFNEKDDLAKAKSMERKQKAKKMIKNGLDIATHQLQQGRDVAWEWPSNNRGWNLQLVRQFWSRLEQTGDLYCGHANGCAFGLREEKSGLPIRKPWLIKTTSKVVARAVSRTCPGTAVHPHHHECVGGSVARNSGFYPSALCDVIFKAVKEMSMAEANGVIPACAYPVFGTGDMEPERPKKTYEPLNEKEKRGVLQMLERLHKKTGHPSNAALSSCLRHRGAHPEVIQLASKHICPECQELRAAPLHPASSLEKSETLWETLVIDNMEFTVSDITYHMMVMVDEASRLMCCHYLYEHPAAESRNATSDEVIHGLESTWILHYGLPGKIRMDPEGAFRSNALGLWAEERGVELLPCAAEDHGQIGIVERSIQTIKATIRQILQGSDCTPWQAAVQSCQAHNQLEKIEGYSPFQWAFGRQPTVTGRFHENGYDDPYWTSVRVPGSSMMKNLSLRILAQQSFLQQQSRELISRASNAKTRRKTTFLPGDLVYFKRIKPPAQPQSHLRLAHKLWRWYGPDRVLASETRTDAKGFERRPSSIIWIVSHGRLKRCSPEQLRHASERERLIAEGMQAPTASWTFLDLAATLFKGEYEILDDHLLPEDLISKGAPKTPRRPRSVGPESGAPTTPRPRRSSSVPRLERAPEDAQRTPEDVRMMQTPKRNVSEMPADEGARQKAKASRTKEEKKTDVFREPSSVNPGTPGLGSGSAPSSGPQSGTRSPIDLGRVIRDPGYDPTAMAQGRNMPELFEQPLFKKQRMKLAAETDDELLAHGFFSSKGEFRLGDLACEIELSLPVKASEWRSMKRDALSFFVKKVKGAEVRWHELSPEKKALFKTAKDAEVSQWLAAQAVRKAIGPVPKDRLVRMRWVLTYKDTGAAKGRIVLIGYEDPDLEDIQSAAPTMTRRTRQLALQYSSVRAWRVLKGDVKSAFLQGEIMEPEDFSFVLSHSKFIEGIEPIEFEARQDHDPVKAEELTQLRGVLGALQWRINQSSPLLAARLGQLQSEISSATVGTLRATNKLLREAFHGRHVSVRVNQLHVGDPLDVCFLGWSDAALANRKDLSSTGGYVIAAASPKMLQGTRSPLSLVSWRSARLQRKARSSLSAETQALAECDQELMFTRLAWAEFCGIQVDLKQPSLAVCRICGAVIVDAKALYDVLIKRDLNSSGAGLKDKYTALEVLCLLESIERNSTIVRWVHSESQIADALTKPLPPGILEKVMVEGSWTLRYDPSFTSSKRLKKAGRENPVVAQPTVFDQ
ncbi:unnamed protein product, partial [Durusdinium trenchii]